MSGKQSRDMTPTREQIKEFDFIEMWNRAAGNDPFWQFEELLEENPELAEAVWDNMRIEILVRARLRSQDI